MDQILPIWFEKLDRKFWTRRTRHNHILLKIVFHSAFGFVEDNFSRMWFCISLGHREITSSINSATYVEFVWS